MQACLNCGKESEDGFAFCPHCAAPLTTDREQRKTVTVLFCDVVGSTALGEAVDAEAARLLAGLRFADRNISLAAEAVKSAQEDLRMQSERYQAGISTELDQLTSQLALTQAQLSLVAARFNYSITRAQLEALVGRQL